MYKDDKGEFGQTQVEAGVNDLSLCCLLLKEGKSCSAWCSCEFPAQMTRSGTTLAAFLSCADSQWTNADCMPVFYNLGGRRKGDVGFSSHAYVIKGVKAADPNDFPGSLPRACLRERYTSVSQARREKFLILR